MRFNDKEITRVSESNSDQEGVLCHLKPQGTEWSDWYQQTSFKERYFKLKANLLFYYRINEHEPLGVLVLENTYVSYERPHKGIPFAFSLTFKVNVKLRDNEAKHIFSCRCEADVNTWVSALKRAPYEYWRSQYAILRTKLAMKTGTDPILEYLQNQTSSNSCITELKRSEVKETKSKFYSHIETSTYYENLTELCSSKQIVTTSSQTNGNTTENLITF